MARRPAGAGGNPRELHEARRRVVPGAWAPVRVQRAGHRGMDPATAAGGQRQERPQRGVDAPAILRLDGRDRAVAGSSADPTGTRIGDWPAQRQPTPGACARSLAPGSRAHLGCTASASAPGGLASPSPVRASVRNHATPRGSPQALCAPELRQGVCPTDANERGRQGAVRPRGAPHQAGPQGTRRGLPEAWLDLRPASVHGLSADGSSQGTAGAQGEVLGGSAFPIGSNHSPTRGHRGYAGGATHGGASAHEHHSALRETQPARGQGSCAQAGPSAPALDPPIDPPNGHPRRCDTGDPGGRFRRNAAGLRSGGMFESNRWSHENSRDGAAFASVGAVIPRGIARETLGCAGLAELPQPCRLVEHIPGPGSAGAPKGNQGEAVPTAQRLSCPVTPPDHQTPPALLGGRDFARSQANSVGIAPGVASGQETTGGNQTPISLELGEGPVAQPVDLQRGACVGPPGRSVGSQATAEPGSVEAGHVATGGNHFWRSRRGTDDTRLSEQGQRPHGQRSCGVGIPGESPQARTAAPGVLGPQDRLRQRPALRCGASGRAPSAVLDAQSCQQRDGTEMTATEVSGARAGAGPAERPEHSPAAWALAYAYAAVMGGAC
jgi:hypothetical protein